jgi:hypothetical protein
MVNGSDEKAKNRTHYLKNNVKQNCHRRNLEVGRVLRLQSISNRQEQVLCRQRAIPEERSEMAIDGLLRRGMARLRELLIADEES